MHTCLQILEAADKEAAERGANMALRRRADDRHIARQSCYMPTEFESTPIWDTLRIDSFKQTLRAQLDIAGAMSAPTLVPCAPTPVPCAPTPVPCAPTPVPCAPTPVPCARSCAQQHDVSTQSIPSHCKQACPCALQAPGCPSETVCRNGPHTAPPRDPA
jgi:hypothetical protein